MLTNMEAFAKDASAIGGFADLNAFNVGSVRQAKVMSGLGESFNKIISESQNGFRVMGENSQDAVENLAQLSRAFRSGTSFFLSGKLVKAMGPQYVKMVDETQQSLASMGATSDDIASAMAATALQVRLSGKTGDEATKALVKGMNDSSKSARELSLTFGVSALKILEASNKFKLSAGGKRAAASGNSEASNVIAEVMSGLNVGFTDTEISRGASVIGRGAGGAQSLTTDINRIHAIGAVEQAERALTSRGQPITTEAMFTELKKHAKSLLAQSRNFTEFNEAEFDSAALVEAAALNLMMSDEERAKAAEKADKDAKSAFANTSEGKNITSMNQLSSSLDTLRNFVFMLTGAIVGFTGIMAPLVAGLTMALISKGALKSVGDAVGGVGGVAGTASDWIRDKVGSIFGSGAPSPTVPPGSPPGGPTIPTAPGGKGKGMSIFGDFLGKVGSKKAVRGAGVIALLGASLALAGYGFQKFSEVTWEGMLKGTIALGGLMGLAKLVGKATTPMLKGAGVIALLGAAVGVAGIGFKQFNDVNWGSTVKGAIAMGVLISVVSVLNGMSKEMLVGAGVLIALGAAVGVAGIGFKQFNDVDWGATVKGAIAMGILGAAASALSNISTNVFIGAGAIAALGAAMWIAGKGFAAFNDVNWESMAKAGIAIGVLAAAAFGLSLIAIPVAIGAAVIAGLGVAVGIFGLGAMVGAIAMDMLSAALAKIGVIDGGNLIAIGGGLAAIGAGMVVFSAGAIVGTASSVITGLMSLFGAKSPLDRIMEFVPYADKISLIGTGIKNFGDGITSVTASLTNFDTDKFSTLKEKLLDFAKAGASDEMRLTAEYLSQIGSSLSTISSITPTLPSTLPTIDSSSAKGPADSSGLTAEGIGQMSNVLLDMLSELKMIKSNTRFTGFPPVRT